MSTFTGFSEDDLKRIKSGETGSKNDLQIINTTNIKKLDKIGAKPKRVLNQYKLPMLQKQSSDDAIDSMQFDKCKLSLKTSPGVDIANNNYENDDKENKNENDNVPKINDVDCQMQDEIETSTDNNRKDSITTDSRRDSTVVTPDIVRGVENYSEDELASHRAKLADLQLKQRLMEEQNKKRKEMLAKALADRTKQTAEEVMRLEKIKKELHVLDGQFSQDVAVLRKKIDLACLSYSEAEKHYLRVEKEFLQAKIHLQKEREKKELLTEHLCALITHNETRKAQKLETLMLELATDRKTENDIALPVVDDDKPVIIDGVDEKTGKMVEFTPES